MESRGESSDARSKGRPAIARRSCDHCRARKIGCDRGSPCSNCVSARLNCTHSAVASNVTTPKQRILISAHYERKIDDIAKDIDGIKLLLQGLNVSPDAEKPDISHVKHRSQVNLVERPPEHNSIAASSGERQWDHSVHIIDFVKAVVEDESLGNVGSETNEVLSSLGNLILALEHPTVVRESSLPDIELFPTPKDVVYQADSAMPPLEAAVAVLRWAKEHESYSRISFISQILPLEKFTEICRKVYFAVEEPSQIDFILATGYLSYIFAENVAVTGLKEYGPYWCLCRKNLHRALSRLPLLLPASMEVIAALALGTLNAIENSNITRGWTFISVAMDHCQRLGYHRFRSGLQIKHNPSLKAAQERLFRIVYVMDKGLSLRLSRPSNIRDDEITLPSDPNESRAYKVARIQGQVYDQLYSPIGLARPAEERGLIAKVLAEDLRAVINETHIEILDTTAQRDSDSQTDPMRIIYLQCDLVCQSSFLALILRAIPPTQNSIDGISEECVVVAREVLDMHDRCMESVRSCKGDPFLVTKYINWAILHTPFVPFSILFIRTVQLLDISDLARLERFATSLKPDLDSPFATSESITHPYRLYELLCQAARLYIDSKGITAWSTDPTLTTHDPSNSLEQFNLAHFGLEVDTATANESGMLAPGVDFRTYGLSEWYYGNQQIMSLLDEEVMF